MGSDMTGSIMEMDYDSLDREIKRSMRRSAGEVVRLGYMLRRMKEGELWAGHYPSMEEYLGKELHMEKTLASRFMAINRRFSVDGEYTDGGIPGQTDIEADFPEWLPEGYQAGGIPVEEGAAGMPCMAAGSGEETMAPQSLETGDMEGEQGEVAMSQQGPETEKNMKSAYGLGKSEYPEGSLTASLGCGNRHYCFSCAQDCGIRQEDRYCVLAPMGNPFSCEMMEILDRLREEDGERCQFVNSRLAPHTAGSGEASPCCRECREECKHRCRRAYSDKESQEAEAWEEPKARYTDPGEEVAMSQQGPDEEPDEDPGDGLRRIKHILSEESRKLDSYMEVSAVEDLPEKLLFRQKTIVAALAAMVCDLENAVPDAAQEEERSQPPMPILKNNDQRKDWLKDYKAWGLWYRDTYIGVDYYKYDFENGARLVAEVYAEHGEYTGDYEYCSLHLVGGPEPPKAGHGWGKWTRHDRYSRSPNSETELVEFLKYTQGKGISG